MDTTSAISEEDIHAHDVSLRPPTKLCGRRRVLFLSIAVPAGVAMGYLCWHFFKQGVLERHQVAFIVSGYSSMCAIILSFWHIYLHLTSYTDPAVQVCMIRIMLMVPIYATISWFSLKFRHIALYLDLVRDTYESYVLYTFFNLLMVYMDGEQQCIEKLREKGSMQHSWPFCHYKVPLGTRFVWWCKAAITIYAIVKPTVALLAIIFSSQDLYHEGDFSLNNAYPYLTVTVNCTVTFAFTCLFYFYRATKDILSEYSPGAKFICVKAVVFVSFWQGIIVATLVKIDIIHATVEWNLHEVAMGLQDFLICIEMLFAAIAHRYVFSHRPFLPQTGRRHTFDPNVLSTTLPNAREVAEDIADLLKHPNMSDEEDHRHSHHPPPPNRKLA